MKNTPTKNSKILITKASGDEEFFSTDKLKRSMLNAGATNEIVSQIVADIENWIYPGVTSKKIYTRAFSFLRQKKKSTGTTIRSTSRITKQKKPTYSIRAIAT